MKDLKKPVARKANYTITVHGHKRTDPYYWMRLSDQQKNATKADKHTQEVLDYLEAENEYANTILKPYEKLEDTLFKELKKRMPQQDESVPYFRNGYWYYSRYEKGKEHAIYCRKKKDLKAKEEILMDVNIMSEGHDYFQLGALTISPDNKVLAYSTDTLGRRIYTTYFKNLKTGKLFPDKIQNASAGGAWANDSKNFFYTKKNKVTLLSEKIARHELGQKSKTDKIVYTEKDPSYYIGVGRSKSGQYITIYNYSTMIVQHHILDANKPKGKFKEFSPRDITEHKYHVEHYKDHFYIITNWKAKNFRLMKTSINATAKENWEEVIPHRKEVLLEDIDIFKDHFVLTEREMGLNQLRVINTKNKEEHYIEFDQPVYTAYAYSNHEFDTPLLRLSYSSMSTPNSVFDYNMNTKKKTLKKRQKVVGGHKPKDYVVERHFAKARDGKKVPISLIYKKGFQKNGKQPLLLYAYGSYGHTIDPFFVSSRLSLLDRGFAYAIAHIRGSQTLGREWYEDGKLLKKMNTFTDFIDCGKYLIKQKYTSAKHLYAMGGSAGGLLMGAVANMAPKTFNGIISAVPFVDVINTMLDESIPLTTNEFNEWGNPKFKKYYDYMLKYSPYENVSEQKYPHMLVESGYFDSQVQYWEPTKWVARLRDLKKDKNLLLLKTKMDAGHSGKTGRFQKLREKAEEFAFLLMLEDMQK